jgi:hypothetical protein
MLIQCTSEIRAYRFCKNFGGLTVRKAIDKKLPIAEISEKIQYRSQGFYDSIVRSFGYITASNPPRNFYKFQYVSCDNSILCQSVLGDNNPRQYLDASRGINEVYLISKKSNFDCKYKTNNKIANLILQENKSISRDVTVCPVKMTNRHIAVSFPINYQGTSNLLEDYVHFRFYSVFENGREIVSYNEFGVRTVWEKILFAVPNAMGITERYNNNRCGGPAEDSINGLPRNYKFGFNFTEKYPIGRFVIFGDKND